MPMTETQEIMFSRYGMFPYNLIIENMIIASVYPVGAEYLSHLKDEEGVTLAINLTESPWPDDWSPNSGIRCIHYPIVDMTAPRREHVMSIIEEIDRNEGITMIHCAAGIGRTGTVIATYMVDKGMDPDEAIRTVRKKRPGSIQTRSQERFVHDWAHNRS